MKILRGTTLLDSFCPTCRPNDPALLPRHCCNSGPAIQALGVALDCGVPPRTAAISVSTVFWLLRLREPGLFSIEKSRPWGDLTAAFQYLKGTHEKDGEQLFAPSDNDRMKTNGFKLKEGRFR